MKNFLILIFGFWIITIAPATAQVINDSGQHGKMQLQTKKGNSANGLAGSPYENEEFRAGKIVMEGNEPVNAYLRYDALNDEIEIKTEINQANISVLPDKRRTEYIIDSIKFLHKSIPNNGKLVKGYFQEYFKGENMSLLKKLSATITEPYKAQTGYEKDRPRHIILQEKYYLSFVDGTNKEVKLKKKDFKKALPSSKALNTYLSDNKFKDIEDFVKMLEWYDKQI